MGEPQFPFDKPRWQRAPKTSDVIRAMHAKQMLPAIFFIFSRVACDESASRLFTVDGICLTSPEEQLLIRGEVDRLRSAFKAAPITSWNVIEEEVLVLDTCLQEGSVRGIPWPHAG